MVVVISGEVLVLMATDVSLLAVLLVVLVELLVTCFDVLLCVEVEVAVVV